MRIAVASGKGGTGKTTVATSLAVHLSRSGRRAAYLDCDVEEPNGRIFLRPSIDREAPVAKPTPVIDVSRCTFRGKCAAACRFGAIACLPNKTLVFPELCHACGGCVLACPTGAVSESPRPIGMLRTGVRDAIRFAEGELDVGEAMSPPLIRSLKAIHLEADITVLDAPPGSSCPVVETLRSCDFVILVTEPTPFGLNDLEIAVDMTRQIGPPMGVVVNRAGMGDRRVQEYCEREGIAVLAEIADDRSIAEAYARGDMLLDVNQRFAESIARLMDNVEREVAA